MADKYWSVISIFYVLILFNILSMHLKLSSPDPVLKTPGSPTFQLITQTETCISPYLCAVNYSDELFICRLTHIFSISVKACQKKMIWGVQIHHNE